MEKAVPRHLEHGVSSRDARLASREVWTPINPGA
jgi:hypothetical protein